MISVGSEPGSPPWGNRLSLRIDAVLRTLFAPTSPAGVPAYADPTVLPPASDYQPATLADGAPAGSTGLVVVLSLNTLAFSDGANWRRADTGGVIA